MITFLLIGLSVVTLLSTVSLVMAWRGAIDGYEDETGFHPTDSEAVPRAGMVPALEQTTGARRGSVGSQVPRIAC